MKLHTSISIFLLGMLLVVASACSPSAPTQNPGPEVTDIQVSKVEATQSVVSEEEFSLPNCEGSEVLSISLATQTSVKKSVTVEATATMTGGVTVPVSPVVKAQLEASIELAYQQTYETATSRLFALEMKAAPKTHIVYVVEWNEQKFSSQATYMSEGKAHTVPYAYTLTVPKVSDSYAVECLTDAETETPAPPIVDTRTETPPLDWTVIKSGEIMFISNNHQSYDFVAEEFTEDGDLYVLGSGSCGEHEAWANHLKQTVGGGGQYLGAQSGNLADFLPPPSSGYSRQCVSLLINGVYIYQRHDPFDDEYIVFRVIAESPKTVTLSFIVAKMP